jgi:hypothetical protein
MAEKTIDDWLDETSIDPSDIPDDYDDTYTDPTLRWRLKEAIQASGKGGNEGEWSARKAQLLTQEYERRGGGYTDDDRSASQQSLEDWTDQDWQTKEGSADADSEDGMGRYLPEEAWALLTDDARREAEKTKQQVDDDGGQIADWPDRVLRTMTEIGYADGDDGLTKTELMDRAQELDVDGRSSMSKSELKDAIVEAYRRQRRQKEWTKDELMDRAQELDVDGRSSMDKDALKDAVSEAERAELEDQTKSDLQDQAADLDVDGRSSMDKPELVDAILQRRGLS